MSKTMLAWQLTGHSLANLNLKELPVPTPGDGEVLIRVSAASLNFRDKAIIDGTYPNPLISLPLVPASDMVGEVIAVGSKVTKLRPGDRVSANYHTRWLVEGEPGGTSQFIEDQLGGPLPGVLAEYVVLPAYSLVKAASTLSDQEAATLPIAALTAWYALVNAGGLKAGQSVLTQGTGGVSLFGIQFARMLGARAIVVSRDPEKLEQVKQIGATDVIDMSKHPDWAKQALALTDGAGVDHILDTLGSDGIPQSVEAAAIRGQITSIGFLTGLEAKLNVAPLMQKLVTIRGTNVGPRSAFEHMSREIDRHGGFKPIIDKVYSFKQIPEAFEHLARGPFGKLVIDLHS